MKIVFTICSNNYLSQAKTLGDSLMKYNPDYKFIIGLCDKKNELVDYSFFEPYEIIEVEELNIPNFDWMIYNYYIIELNTSIKSFFFQYFIQKYKDLETIMYFDPDIKIFNKLSFIEDELQDKAALLTPHILSPIPLDKKTPQEINFLNYGIYNLGFLAIKPCESACKMLEWWSERMAVQCFDRVAEGLFVDQLPMNFAPIFFEKVCASHSPGYNYAYWNFHERKVTIKDGEYFINQQYPLVFLHYSSFKPSQPIDISFHQSRYKLEPGTLLHNLFSEYAEELINNKYVELKEIKCYYSVLRDNYLKEKSLVQEEYHRKESNTLVRIKNKLISIIKR